MSTVLSPFTRLTQAAVDVLQERKRQQLVEGYDEAHDAAYTPGVLALAGACYAAHQLHPTAGGQPPQGWPWTAEHWKPAGVRRDLVRAAALILAEIEKADCQAQSSPSALPLGTSEITSSSDTGATGFLYSPPEHVIGGPAAPEWLNGGLLDVYTAGRWSLIRCQRMGIAWYALGPTGGWLVFSNALHARDWITEGRATRWHQWGRH